MDSHHGNHHQLLEMKPEIHAYPSIANSLGPLAVKNDETEEEETSPSTSRKGNSKKRGVKRQEKPPLSYISLIALAIQQRPDKKATLAEIYTYLQDNYEFFRGEYAGWRNSIRHNLSLNDCFVKLPKDAGERGRKGHKWTISNTCEFLMDEGAFRRRPRGYKARKRPVFPYQPFDFAASPEFNMEKVMQEQAAMMPLAQNMQMALPVAYSPFNCGQLAAWNNCYDPAWYGGYPSPNETNGYFYPESALYENWPGVEIPAYPIYPLAPSSVLQTEDSLEQPSLPMDHPNVDVEVEMEATPSF